MTSKTMKRRAFWIAALLCVSTNSFSQSPTPRWTGTWSVAPQRGTLDTRKNLRGFEQKTLRQSFRVSVGGSKVRIRLSNLFGQGPLTISDVHIARAASERAIIVESDKAITFHHQASVVIPAGESVVSDAVEFPVKPLSDVTVSLYSPDAIEGETVTTHAQGDQNVFVADGDVSGKSSIAPTGTLQSYYFLTNVDVWNSEAAGALVAFGASITDSSNSTFGANLRWTNLLAKRLDGAKGPPVGVLNEGISGNRLLSDGAGESAMKRFERDVLSQTGVRWVVFSDDPINDLSSRSESELPSADQLIEAVKSLIAQAHRKGVQFYCSTLSPNGGRSARDWSEAAERTRQQINDFYRSPGSPCDGMIDLDRALRDPADLIRFKSAYDSGDHLHPNDAGMAAIADQVRLLPFRSTPPRHRERRSK